MTHFLRVISKAGRAFRYIGVVACIAAIVLGKYNVAGIIGLLTFFCSFLFRTDETGDTPLERRSAFEKMFGLPPEDQNDA